VRLSRATASEGKRRPLTCHPTKRTRISCHAALTKVHVCGFRQGKPHEVRRRQQYQQEIRGSAVEDLLFAYSATALDRSATLPVVIRLLFFPLRNTNQQVRRDGRK